MKRYRNNLFKTLMLFAAAPVFLSVFFDGQVLAQNTLPYDTSYTFDHYKIKRELYKGLPTEKNEIVFLGNSITERGKWSELFKNKNIINRGIGGDVCFGVLNRLNEVLESSPKAIFLMIGINDIGRSVPVDTIAGKIQEIINRIKAKSSQTKICLQSVLPINEEIFKGDYMKGKSVKIVQLNRLLRSLAAKEKVQYIDLYPRFADQNGILKSELTADGIHLNETGYLLWRDVFKEEGVRF